MRKNGDHDTKGRGDLCNTWQSFEEKANAHFILKEKSILLGIKHAVIDVIFVNTTTL